MTTGFNNDSIQDMPLSRHACSMLAGLSSSVQSCLIEPLYKPCQSIIKACVNELELSARAHDKILRVARTLADLDASDQIEAHHLQEAVNYRILDRNLWN